MTQISRACDSFDFHCNTNSVGSDDNEKMFFSRFEIIEFSTEVKVIDFIYLMGNNVIPTAIAIGKIDTIFISDH